MDKTIYQFRLTDLHGQEIDFAEYKDKVLLIVNTATQCGYTHQLEGLEKLYRQYRDSGFYVIGFPSNQFEQEPLEGEKILEYCLSMYGVTFPMMEKGSVKGKNAQPLFKFFASKRSNGKIRSKPRWNFYKYLIGKNGEVIDYFITITKPGSRRIRRAIEKALKADA